MVAPYVMLSVVFATLNARLHLPPYSLFGVALTLTSGEHAELSNLQLNPRTYEFCRNDDDLFFQSYRHWYVERNEVSCSVTDDILGRVVARDRAIDQLLLYYIVVAGVVCWDLCWWRDIDGGNIDDDNVIVETIKKRLI
jgi:hypothetical protein